MAEGRDLKQSLDYLLEPVEHDSSVKWLSVVILSLYLIFVGIDATDSFFHWIATDWKPMLLKIHSGVEFIFAMWLLFLVVKAAGNLRGSHLLLMNQRDQTSIRLIEGKHQVNTEFKRLINESDTINFYGPIDDPGGFGQIFIDTASSNKDIKVYDTLLTTTNKTSIDRLIAMDMNPKLQFRYSALLYKQLVGVILAETGTSQKQLLFFRNSTDRELIGILINKNFKVYSEHITDDLPKGVGPQIDFKDQMNHIKNAFDTTLNIYWKPMYELGWTHPVLPPVVENKKAKADWEAAILDFFKVTSLHIAGKAKKIVITWRVVDDSLDQANNIVDWLLFLRDDFAMRDGCSVRRIVLVDEIKFSGDQKYKNVVNKIRATYFPSTNSGSYTVECRTLRSIISGNEGLDFAGFYDSDNQIIAVQGSEYDKNHNNLLRIYFDRSQDKIKKYTSKLKIIETTCPLIDLT